LKFFPSQKVIIHAVLLSRAARARSSSDNIVEGTFKFPHSGNHSVFAYSRRPGKDNE
jgi:hypothetical protein